MVHNCLLELTRGRHSTPAQTVHVYKPLPWPLLKMQQMESHLKQQSPAVNAVACGRLSQRVHINKRTVGHLQRCWGKAVPPASQAV